MLKIFNELRVFFEDCYKDYSVREYAREMKISPPTASKILKEYSKKGLLMLSKERGFLLFRANKENKLLKDLSRIYWNHILLDLTKDIYIKLNPFSITLIGSLSKLETTKKSDIDLVIITKSKQKIDLEIYEKNLGKKIQLFTFDSFDKINKDLKLNVVNGYILRGYTI